MEAERSAARQAERAEYDERRELLGSSARTLRGAFGREYERNVLRLAVQRRTLAWIDGVRSDLDGLRPDADTFVRLEALERALALRSHHLRPAEQDQALLLAVAARREHADATAVALAKRAVRTATGQPGIAALSYFWPRQPALDRLVSDQARATIDASIDAGLDGLIEVVVRDLRGRIRALEAQDDPLEALALGAAIYRDFLASIGAARRRPLAQAVVDLVTARRARDLTRVVDSVSERIMAAPTADEARRIAGSVITLPGDAETLPGQLLQTRVTMRTIQLEREALLALFSERERELLDESTGRIDVSGAPVAPTAEEVRLATLRAFAHDGGRMLDPSTCLHVVPGLGRLDIRIRMSIEDVRISSVVPGEDGTYAVVYSFRRRMQPEGALSMLVNDDSWQGTLLLDMLDAFGDNLVETSADVFVLTPGGWVSPSLLARLDLASALQPLRVMTGERRRR